MTRPVILSTATTEDGLTPSWTADEGETYSFSAPTDLFERYVEVAMRRALPRQLDNASWYADLPGFPGVWADGPSPKECLEALAEVLSDWLLLKLRSGDRDIPMIDDIDLTAALGRQS